MGIRNIYFKVRSKAAKEASVGSVEEKEKPKEKKPILEFG